MLGDYSDHLRYITKVTGLLSLSTKRAICFVLNLASLTIKEIDLKPFSLNHKPVFRLWGSFILALQDCINITSVALDVPRHVFQQLLVVLQRKQPRHVAIRFGSSGNDDLTANVVNLCRTTGISGHLFSLSFEYKGRRHIDIGEVLRNFPSPSLETLEHLFLNVHDGPQHAWVEHLIRFAHLKVLTFAHIVWSKQAVLEV